MKCPCCGQELTIGEELLYRIENVYYCPHCFVKITGWPRKEAEAQEHRDRLEPEKTELGEADRHREATTERVLEKGVS